MDREPFDDRLILRLPSRLRGSIDLAALAERRTASNWVRAVLEEAATKVVEREGGADAILERSAG